VTIGDAASTKSQTVTMADVATAINTALGPVTGNTVTASVNATSGKLTLANSATGASASTALTNFTGITASMLGFSKTSSTGSDAGDLSVATQPGANRALDTIDSAIDTVSKTRADIGATESRFEFRAETIATSTENLTAANSAITDVDVASEEAKLASAAVKTQAAVAAAAQANQMPQELLKLMQYPPGRVGATAGPPRPNGTRSMTSVSSATSTASTTAASASSSSTKGSASTDISKIDWNSIIEASVQAKLAKADS